MGHFPYSFNDETWKQPWKKGNWVWISTWLTQPSSIRVQWCNSTVLKWRFHLWFNMTWINFPIKWDQPMLSWFKPSLSVWPSKTGVWYDSNNDRQWGFWTIDDGRLGKSLWAHRDVISWTNIGKMTHVA